MQRSFGFGIDDDLHQTLPSFHEYLLEPGGFDGTSLVFDVTKMEPTPGTFMTVPAPSQSGDVMNTSYANSTTDHNGLANQEVHIAKIQNTMAVMEDQNLTSDPRYANLHELKERLQARMPIVPATTAAVPSSQPSTDSISPEQRTKFVDQLKAQVAAYKFARTGASIPANILTEATAQVPIKGKIEALPPPYQIPLDVGETKLPYDITRLHQMMQWKATKRPMLPMPKSIDPNVIAKEREQRISSRIMSEIKHLSNLPSDLPEHLRIKAAINLRGLRLINLQAAVRQEVLHALKVGSTVEYGLNAHAYRRVKKHTLREARLTEKLEKQQKAEQERRRRLRHADFLQSTIQASKDFVTYHKNNRAISQRLRKAVATHHANSEKERKKEEEKNEKLRLMKLMQEDEEGYRQLLDEKKDKRLVYLLEQTDEYVKSLTGLVKQHQQTEKKRKKQEREAARKALENDDEIQVIIRNCATGEILKPDETPKQEELEAWLEIHPGYEIVSRNVASDSDDDEDREEPVKAVQVEEKEDDELDGLTEEERNQKILDRARNEEDEYDQKTRMQMESYYATAHRIKEKVVKQHSSLGGGDPNLLLKPYQIKGLEWMVSLYNNNLNGILADEMGLGKTIQTVALITYLMEVKKVNGPYLVIVPLSTISNWVLEFDKWAPHVTKVVYKGEKDARKRMDIIVKKGAFNVLLTTYEYVIKEKNLLGKIKWKYMIIDEGHRMKNHTCKLTLTLNAYFSVQHRLLLTGTPLQNKLPELWALLNFLLPSIFSSCGTFEQWFNAPFATTGEKVELNQEETMLIIRRLHKVLRPFLLRRLKKEVESQLPEKTEQVIKCNMTCLQRLLYEHMKNGLLLDSSSKRGRALQNTIMHLRKLCNHPFLFESVEVDCRAFWNREINGVDLCRVAGKFDLLDRILTKLQSTGHRILIFCQMTNTMTIMEDFFNYKGWLYLRLDGSTKHDERGELLKTFNAPDSKYNLFMLSTRAGGLGLNLQTADTVIIFDSDWNPHQDMQAQDRAHRIGQKKEVRVLRLITVNSVEEKILAAARYKLNIDEKVIQAGKFDQRSTDAERRQILEAIISREDDNDEDEVPDDETINNMIARGDEEFEIFQQMDIERREEEKQRSFERLIQENEIPENLIERANTYTAELEESQNPDRSQASFIDDGDASGRRARKKVDYTNDLMTDSEWLRTIDEPISDDDEPKKPEPGKRGRKKKAPREEEPQSDDERRGPPPKKRAKDDPMQAQLTSMLDTLVEYKDSDGRVISTDFIQLPSRRELPDYYEIVNQPIDFHKIRKNLKKGFYDTVDALGADVRLLCKNAQKFNREDSEIYRDSKILLAVWEKIQSQVAAASDQPGPSGSSKPPTTTSVEVKEE